MHEPRDRRRDPSAPPVADQPTARDAFMVTCPERGGELGEGPLEIGPRFAQHDDWPGFAGPRGSQQESRLDDAAPFLALEAEGRVDRRTGRHRQTRSCPEMNRSGSCAARADVEADVVGAVIAAEADRILECRSRDEQRDRRVSGTERREPEQLLGELETKVLAGDDRVDPLARDEVRRFEDCSPRVR